jgi:hypothetical protein
VAAYESLEEIEMSIGTGGFSMSFELAAGSVCTALLALDDYRDGLSDRGQSYAMKSPHATAAMATTRISKESLWTPHSLFLHR